MGEVAGWLMKSTGRFNEPRFRRQTVLGLRFGAAFLKTRFLMPLGVSVLTCMMEVKVLTSLRSCEAQQVIYGEVLAQCLALGRHLLKGSFLGMRWLSSCALPPRWPSLPLSRKGGEKNLSLLTLIISFIRVLGGLTPGVERRGKHRLSPRKNMGPFKISYLSENWPIVWESWVLVFCEYF